MPEDRTPGIVITDRPIEPSTLRALIEQWFGDMVKLVVDVNRGLVAIGGELHADAEARLSTAAARPICGEPTTCLGLARSAAWNSRH